MAKIIIGTKLHTTTDGDLLEWKNELTNNNLMGKTIRTGLRILKKMMAEFPGRDFHAMAEESRLEWYRKNGGV